LTSLRILAVLVGAVVLTGAAGASSGLASTTRSAATAIDLGTLGGTFSEAVDVSPSGQVVGVSTTVGDARFGELHAFSWTQKGGMVDLGTLGGFPTEAVDENARGEVVGDSVPSSNPQTSHAFSWTRTGGMVDLGTLGGVFSFATALNARGDVVGESVTADEAAIHATLWHT
jgi:probable HAF family extracellular repeat protein